MVVIISSVVNFTIVLFILWFFGRKPITEFFSHRRQTIASAIGDAEAQYANAQNALQTWQDKWASCAAQGKQMFEEAKSSAAKFRDRSLSAAKLEAERIDKESALTGKGEILRARHGLQQEVAQQSIMMAENFLQKQLEDRDKHGLISEYVEIVGNGKA